MEKNYTLISMVNGHELPTQHVSTFAKAEAQVNHLMDRYGLELDEQTFLGADTYYKCTKYRTWFRICVA